MLVQRFDTWSLSEGADLTQEVEAANDEELPTRANVSAMLSFRREF